MARRSSRIPELMEKNELSCMWGLFSILESCQSRSPRIMISNGRRVDKHIIDYPSKVEQLASFDEECRKIQNGSGLRSVSARSVENFIEEDRPIDKNKIKESVATRRGHSKMDIEFDRIVKTQKRARKSSEKAYQSSSSYLDNAANLIQHLPSSPAEISLSKLNFAAILEAVSARNHQEECKLTEYLQRSGDLGNDDMVNEINIQQVQMRAKALVDQMFIDKRFICREGKSSESKSFSTALEVLNSNKNRFMEALPDPNSLLVRHIKKTYPSQRAKETVRSILDANFSGRESLDASSLANINKNFLQKSDKIVILRPTPRNTEHSEDVICRCSSMHSHKKMAKGVSDAKSTSFSFREMKRKLKHTLGITRKERNQLFVAGTSDKLSQDRSNNGVGDECISGGVNIRNSFGSSTSSDQKGKLSKKQDLYRRSGNASTTDAAHKKIDLSKRDFDVILEAKKHLSARLNYLISVEAVTSKRSPKTLGRILSSPEHDFRPLSPRRDSQCWSASAQMRFSPYNSSPKTNESRSQIPNGRERTCLSALRSNTEATSSDDHDKYDCALHIVDTKTGSLIPSTDKDARYVDITATENMITNGESMIVETKSFLPSEFQFPEEVLSTIGAMHTTSTNSTQKDDEIVLHSISDSLSENEANTSTMDDFASTPSSIYHLETANSIKYQEHRSPVSVLEPFYIEDADSPPSITLQTARKQLQPRRLEFEECSIESLPQDSSISTNFCIEEEDHLSQYVELVLQASCLNWDHLSEIRSPPDELLHESLFDEVEFPPVDCYYDPKLLFDHINEVLIEIYKCHFWSPPWLAFPKPKTMSVPLAELVFNEIMTEADFYLLPRTERRTLDELVSKDVVKCRSWLDVQLDVEQIVIDVSEDFLEESMLDIVLEFHT